ncbi:MAG TPA: hypothetical protein VFB60_29585 [Ktedonobacteraceae bacterium]|nr:hypothetical protein [Ktedonobacteraceae bacterium]
MSKEFFNARDNPLRALATVDEKSPIGQKWLELGGKDGLGDPFDTAQPFSDQVGSYQQFANGAIFYSIAYGAVVVSSTIFAKWASISVTNAATYCGDLVQDYLGYPTDDFFSTAEGGYAAYFERGTIIIRWNSRAYVVYEEIYGHYRELGDVRGALHLPEVGLPESDEEVAPGGGRRSRFERGDIYWHPATGAHEVHGAIREHWLALGGTASFLGYPTSDEMSVTRGSSEIGRSQHFQHGAVIYWSPETGAWEVHGEVRRALEERFGGVTGGLGFPVSDEKDTPAFTGRFNNFQNGVIVWQGDLDHTYQVLGLELYLESFTASDSFNVQIDIRAFDSQMHQINRGRMPASGNYNGSSDSATLMSVDRVQGDLVWTIWMEAIHEVLIGTDDRLGTIQKSYSIDDNLWGMLDTSHAHSSTGSFVAEYRFRPMSVEVDLDPKKFRDQLFWPFNNFTTTKLNWSQYARTFQDINEADRKKPWHPFEIVFYEAVYNAIAEDGNCFGMGLESIYARIGKSLFEEPINTSPFNSYRHDGQKLDPNAPQDGEAINEINIKQGYQLGVGLINWLLEETIAGHLHDPLRAYHESKAAYERGDFPLLSLSQKSKLSQHGHAVVPFYWDNVTRPDGPWLIHVADPNYAVAASGDDVANASAFYSVLSVFPGDNTFKYTLDGDYGGGEEDGGRMWSIPFSRLNSQPSTPGWEILALLAGAVLIILAGDGETRQITDEGGATFYEYLDVPASSTTMMMPGLLPRKRINENAYTHIAEMARVPFHNQFTTSADEGLVNADPQTEVELYYLRRNPFPPCWEQGTRTDQGARAAFGPHGTRASIHEKAPHISRASRGDEEMVTNLARSLLETTLIHEVLAPQGEQYRWAIRAPRMSASISAPGTDGIADTITVGQVGLAEQAVSLLVAAKSEAKQVTIAVAGWSGNGAAQARWFELNNMMMEPNHTVTVQVNNGGQELLLQNSGPSVTFELQVHAGLSNQAVRSNVTIEAGKAARIRPTNWSPETIATVPVLMDLMDTPAGHVVRQIIL